MTPIDRYLYEDKITAKKIIENPEFYDQLEAANKCFDGLKITDKIDFYRYSIVIEQFKYITYDDIQAFKRFQDKEYFEYVKNSIPKKTKPKLRIIKNEVSPK